MSDCEISRLDVFITKETYDKLIELTNRQNANLGNNVSRLIRIGIEETYRRWPNLAKPEINGGNVADKVAENTVNVARSIHTIGGPGTPAGEET